MKSNLCHLTLQKPPEFLFCAVNAEESFKVFRTGLNRLKSPFIETFATERDARRSIKGYADAFVILSGLMAEEGYRFYHAETGEWLTDEIPSRYLRLC